MGTFFGQGKAMSITPEMMAITGGAAAEDPSKVIGGDDSVTRAPATTTASACLAACKEAYDLELAAAAGSMLRKNIAIAKYSACKQRCSKTKSGGGDSSTGKSGGASAGACPEGIAPGGEWAGCGPCGKKYMLPEGGTCLANYVPVPKPDGTQCECVKWCQDIGYGADCVSGSGQGGTNQLGEFKFQPELYDLYNMLMGKGKEYLERRPGFSGGALELMLGAGTDNMRRGELGAQSQIRSALQTQGMTGTGAGMAMMRQPARETERNVGNLIRELALANEMQTRADRESYTGIGDKLFGTGVNFRTGEEMINSARRGQGLQAQALWLEYLKSLMDSWSR